MIVATQRFRVVFRRLSQEALVLPLYTSDKCDVLSYTTRKCSVTILYPATGNIGANTHNAMRDGKVECNSLAYTTAFLCSDWLNFFMAWYIS